MPISSPSRVEKSIDPLGDHFSVLSLYDPSAETATNGFFRSSALVVLISIVAPIVSASMSGVSVFLISIDSTSSDGMVSSATERTSDSGDGIRTPLIDAAFRLGSRSEEHTSELQSLMRISYAVFCLKKKKTDTDTVIY